MKKNTVASSICFITLAAFSVSALLHDFAAASLWEERRSALSKIQAGKPDVNLPPAGGREALPKEDNPFPGIVIPEKYGKIIETFCPVNPGDERPLVIHIQDAHNDYNAQNNLAEIVRILMKAGKNDIDGPFLVASEGVSGEVFADWISILPGPSVRVRAARNLLRQNLITGEEYLAILEGPRKLRIERAEDETMLRANVAARRLAAIYKEEALNSISLLETQLQIKRSELGNRQLVSFVDAAIELDPGSAGIHHYLQCAAPHLSREMLEKYPHFNSLGEMIRMESKLDLQAVERQRDRFMREAVNRLSARSLRRLVELSIRFRTGGLPAGEYYSFLADEAARAGLSLPNLDGYARYLRNMDNVNMQQALQEIRLVNKEIARKLASKPEEERWAESALKASAQKRFWTEQVTSSEWEERLQCERHDDGIFGNADFPFARFLQESYYELALKRDARMVHNCLDRAKANGANKIALIAGGFHTKGIVRMLRERQIPYVVIQPSLSEVEESGNDLSEHADEFHYSTHDFVRDLRELSKRPGAAHRDLLEEIIDQAESLAIGKTSRAEPSISSLTSVTKILFEEHRLRNPSRLDTARLTGEGAVPLLQSIFASLSGRNPAAIVIDDLDIARPSQQSFPERVKRIARSIKLPARFGSSSKFMRKAIPATLVGTLGLFGFPAVAFGQTYFQEGGRTKVLFESWDSANPEENTLWGVSREILQANGNSDPSGAEIMEQIQRMAGDLQISDPNLVYAGDSFDITSFLSGPDAAAQLTGQPVLPTPAPVQPEIPLPSVEIPVPNVPGEIAIPENPFNPAVEDPMTEIPDAPGDGSFLGDLADFAADAVDYLQSDVNWVPLLVGFGLGLIIGVFFSERLRRLIKTAVRFAFFGPGLGDGDSHDHGEDHDHAHSHDHAHDRTPMSSRSLKGLVAAMFITLAFAAVEMFGSMKFNSHTLWTDAWHMITDSAGMSAALVVGLYPRVRKIISGQAQPLNGGYKKIEVAMGLFSGLALGAVGLFTLYEIVGSLWTGAEAPAGKGIFVVGVLGLTVNLFVLKWLGGHDLASRGARLHVLSDMITSAFAILSGFLIWTAASLSFSSKSNILDPILALIPTLWTLRWAYGLLASSLKLAKENRLEEDDRHDPDDSDDSDHPDDDDPPGRRAMEDPGLDLIEEAMGREAPPLDRGPARFYVPRGTVSRIFSRIGKAMPSTENRRNLILIHADDFYDSKTGEVLPLLAHLQVLRGLNASVDGDSRKMFGIVVNDRTMNADKATDIAAKLGIPAGRLVLFARTPQDAVRYVRQSKDLRIKEASITVFTSGKHMKLWGSLGKFNLASIRNLLDVHFEIRLSGDRATVFAAELRESGLLEESAIQWENGDLVIRAAETEPAVASELWKRYNVMQIQA